MENNIMLVHSGKWRSKKARLRDEIEILKCQIENLENENRVMAQLLKQHGIEWKGIPDE